MALSENLLRVIYFGLGIILCISLAGNIILKQEGGQVCSFACLNATHSIGYTYNAFGECACIGENATCSPNFAKPTTGQFYWNYS